MAQGLKDAALVRSGYRCNSACRFCDQGDWRETRGDRPADEVLADVLVSAEAAARGSGVLVLSGGEITLRRELPEWVAAAREAGARTVVVQTNGRMLSYKKWARQLVEAGCDVVAVALHGPDAPLHDYLTRSEGSFDQAVVGMGNVRRYGAKVYVNTVITRSNFRHLPDMALKLPVWGAQGIRFNWPRTEGVALELAPSIIPHPEMVAPHLRRAMEIAKKLKRRVDYEGPVLEERSTRSPDGVARHD